MVNARPAPLANVPPSHVTTCPLAAQDVPGGADGADEREAGRAACPPPSRRWPAFGPLLVTVIGYCTVPPATTDAGDDVFVTARSARALTVVATTLPVKVKSLPIVWAR